MIARALALALALALAAAGLQSWRLASLRDEVAQAERNRAEALRLAELAAQRRVEGIARETNTRLARARADADGARAELDRLRLAAADTAATASPATAGEAATGPGLVLADVLSGAAGRAVELAAALDAARTAGTACERSFDALTPNH